MSARRPSLNNAPYFLQSCGEMPTLHLSYTGRIFPQQLGLDILAFRHHLCESKMDTDHRTLGGVVEERNCGKAEGIGSP